ncbi:MAG: hypothetical protein L0241_14880 [Planctomycetia bacterium]|nr:hypothetical protein [Planctomycetia bacterium]
MSHLPFRVAVGLLLTVPCGWGVAQDIAPAPKLAPINPDDLLEQLRMRIRIAEERATADVADAEVQIAVVFLISPQTALDIAKKARKAVADNPDISESCRQRLMKRLNRFIRE